MKMTPMNNDLQVGQQAIIIGCHNPENSGCIGKVVTIVDFVNKGEPLPDFYMQIENVDKFAAKVNLAVITDSGAAPDNVMIENHIFINVKYLMPLPPLGDVYEEEMRDELENLKVSCP